MKGYKVISLGLLSIVGFMGIGFGFTYAIKESETISVKAISVEEPTLDSTELCANLYSESTEGSDVLVGLFLDDKELENTYGLKPDDILSYCVSVPLKHGSVTEIAIFKIDDKNYDTLRNALLKRQETLESRKNTCSTANYEAILQSKMLKNGDYVIYAVGKETDKVIVKFLQLTSRHGLYF